MNQHPCSLYSTATTLPSTLLPIPCNKLFYYCQTQSGTNLVYYFSSCLLFIQPGDFQFHWQEVSNFVKWYSMFRCKLGGCLAVFKIQHFCCFITKLVKKLMQWYLYLKVILQLISYTEGIWGIFGHWDINRVLGIFGYIQIFNTFKTWLNCFPNGWLLSKTRLISIESQPKKIVVVVVVIIGVIVVVVIPVVDPRNLPLKFG